MIFLILVSACTNNVLSLFILVPLASLMVTHRGWSCRLSHTHVGFGLSQSVTWSYRRQSEHYLNIATGISLLHLKTVLMPSSCIRYSRSHCESHNAITPSQNLPQIQPIYFITLSTISASAPLSPMLPVQVYTFVWCIPHGI